MSDQTIEDRARDVTVLSGSEMVLGIPFQIFMLVLALAVPVAFVVSFIVGGAIGFIGLYAMYQIHKNDPQACQVWVGRIRSLVKCWRAAQKQAREIVLL
jgi:type IV secretory pathway VirB3-like protein